MVVLGTIDIKKKFKLPGQKPIWVLNGVNLSVKPGEKVAIIGKSGAGKSTLLNILGGLEKQTSGTVTRPKNIGFVFQQYHLMPELTVLENVRLPLYAARFNGVRREGTAGNFLNRREGTAGNFSYAPCPQGAADKFAYARELLEKVGLGDRLDHLPGELSGGEQQRVALCRALVTKPDLVLADEPTGNLDAWTGAGILKILSELSASRTFALVMVTHSPEAAAVCDRTLTLDKGVLEEANGER